MKKYGIRLFVIFTLILLGGCTMDKKNEEQQIVNKAKEKTIQYFQKTEGLDVTITDYRFPSNDLESVFITGHIKDDESKEFTATIDYNNNYNVGSVSTNFTLKK
ncbi:hypothetical protein IIM_00226 [Bacillus cereus VD107]|nr:hypothetical protein IIM_00226 [Bacillus cereus VD107]